MRRQFTWFSVVLALAGAIVCSPAQGASGLSITNPTGGTLHCKINSQSAFTLGPGETLDISPGLIITDGSGST